MHFINAPAHMTSSVTEIGSHLVLCKEADCSECSDRVVRASPRNALHLAAALRKPLLHMSLDVLTVFPTTENVLAVLLQIRDSVQHFAGDPAAKGAAVKPEAVTEEGVLHLFGPDGLLVIQYDATVLPKDVAEDVMRRLQEYEKRSPAKRSAK